MVNKGEPDPVTRVRTVQKPVYYVSKVLHEAKARYLETHKLIYVLALLKYPFYPLFILDNGMNLISKSLTVLTPA